MNQQIIQTEILSKDFIASREGLVFAVLDQKLEQGKVLCFLRYIQQDGSYKKMPTMQANDFLQAHYPQYLYYSQVKDTALHAVHVTEIARHFRPRQRLQALLAKPEAELDVLEKDLQDLMGLFQQQGLNADQFGITGSMLIGAQNPASDIDLVIYQRDVFFQTRTIIQQLFAVGSLQPLQARHWQQSYQRRNCDLSLEEYVAHEQRKFNKALINDRKFDIALLDSRSDEDTEQYKKAGTINLRTVISDATYAYDYPVCYGLQHEEIKTCLCYTATYTGQAEQGETVQISGLLEVSASGRQRIIVGSSREAAGEFIKVVTRADR